jgi:hypothetical protein
MQFDLPTTKEQMYETLKEIFYYYRIRREGWEGVELLPLELERMQFTPLSENDIKDRIEKCVAPEITMGKWQEIQSVEKQISAMKTKKVNLGIALEEQKNLIAQQYSLKSKVITQDALARGTAQSTIITKELADLESQKADEISQANQSYNDKIADIDATISALEQKKTEIEQFYQGYKAELLDAKLLQSLETQENFGLEVLKYNNGVEEREVKHANSVTNRTADLELKIRELNQTFFSKDQLVEMGYYEDVIDCVCGYYDRLDPMTAYQQINGDKKVPIYLDDYYTNILYLYRSRAGQ